MIRLLLIFTLALLGAANAQPSTTEAVKSLYDLEKRVHQALTVRMRYSEDRELIGEKSCPSHVAAIDAALSSPNDSKQRFMELIQAAGKAYRDGSSDELSTDICLAYAATHYEPKSILYYALLSIDTRHDRAKPIAAALLVIGPKEMRDIELAKKLLQEAKDDPKSIPEARERYDLTLTHLMYPSEVLR